MNNHIKMAKDIITSQSCYWGVIISILDPKEDKSIEGLVIRNNKIHYNPSYVPEESLDKALIRAVQAYITEPPDDDTCYCEFMKRVRLYAHFPGKYQFTEREVVSVDEKQSVLTRHFIGDCIDTLDLKYPVQYDLPCDVRRLLEEIKATKENLAIFPEVFEDRSRIKLLARYAREKEKLERLEKEIAPHFDVVATWMRMNFKHFLTL